MKDYLYLKITPLQQIMKKRREAIDLAREVYLFLKKNKSKEFSINRVLGKMKAKYEITIKCLTFLKDVDLVKERKGSRKPIPERLFSFKR